MSNLSLEAKAHSQIPAVGIKIGKCMERNIEF
jgi:hypothetical protein